MSQLKSLDSQPLSPPPSLAAQPPEPGVEAGHVLRRVLLDGRASVLVLICLPYMSALYVCLIRAVGWACLGPRPPPILASSLPPSPSFPICLPHCLLPSLSVYVYAIACARALLHARTHARERSLARIREGADAARPPTRHARGRTQVVQEVEQARREASKRVRVMVTGRSEWLNSLRL